ncbi:MAG: nucleotidyltransferase family protein [Chloroflexi bacterium]|nr:nucleotidyltransferase family protein [Chloroflexota bacterium]
MQTAAVILAAGASTRFGSPKQLAPFGAGTLLDAVVRLARDAGLWRVVVVLPSAVPPPAGVTVVVNDAPAEGLSRSLRLGLAAVPDEAAAALILLGDQPTVPAAVIADILHARGERPIVAARAAGLLGPPVLLERSAFGMAAATTGDEGLRYLIRGNRHLVTPIEVGEHAPDVDTPADLERMV